MPNDIGPQHPNDALGWLCFDGLPDEVQRAEDATLAADHHRITEDMLLPFEFVRPATDTERILLEHIGFDHLPDNLTTTVRWLSFGLRNRRWPALEGGSS
jgi:hypothetical protein